MASLVGCLTGIVERDRFFRLQPIPVQNQNWSNPSISIHTLSAPSTFNYPLNQSVFDLITFGLLYNGLLTAQEELPFIPLVNKLLFEAVRVKQRHSEANRIQNVKYSALGGIAWNIYELKVVDN